MNKSFPSDPQKDSLGQKIAVGLNKIGQALKNKAWQEGLTEGVTPTQGQILSFLLGRRKGAEASLNDVVEHLAVSAATVSEAVHVLEEKGLVSKTSSAQDRRYLAIVLTSSGRRIAQKAAGWPDFLLTSIDSLSLEEQQVFLRALIKMMKTLQDNKEIPFVPMCATCRHFQPYIYKNKDKPHHCGFVDAAFGHQQYQMQCPDHERASGEAAEKIWEAFLDQRPVRT